MDKLEVVRESTTGGWAAAQRFLELKDCLRGNVSLKATKSWSKQLSKPSGQDECKIQKTCASHSYQFGISPLFWEQDMPLDDEKGSLHELLLLGWAQVQANRSSLSTVSVVRMLE